MIKNVSYMASKIAEVTNGILVGDNCEITSISLNSRECEENTCFFAIKGENFDGHDYVDQAIQNGAKLIIAQKLIDVSVSIIYVNDVIMALGLLAKEHKGDTKVIGITGSVGKTTTKNMIKAVLSEKYSVCGTEKNYNNEIGVPLTLLSITNEDYCVVEMGMRGLGQIDWLAYICKPEIVVITNCTEAHLEALKSRENIFNAKTEILNYNPSIAIVPYEERFVTFNYQATKTIFLGKGGDNYIERIIENSDDMEITLKTGEKYRLNSIFKCNAYNSLIAYTVGKLLNVSNEKIRNGLLKFKKEENREEVIKLGQTTIINDCYNASYESMKEVILSATDYAKRNNKKLYFLLGDMLELGNDSGEFHKEIGAICKQSGANGAFLYGKFAKFIQKGLDGGELIENNDKYLDRIAMQIKGGVLLVKASRKANFEKIIDKLKEKLNE
ncbi:MAG: UDP-N-acetylmuramoyl-tripeptide--D-alanyl-D-alanine ligase [Clostridia bacterium]|nr:UDP-N-acetylmuramoyl-tripeptide--D-alanyl-D-alanine ligase [Clostridia bacterium]